MTGLRSATPSRHGSGQELVEFAIVLPVLILILFGVLDLGRIFHGAIVIVNAAREGARYGVIHPDDGDGIIAAAQAEAQSSGIDLTDGTISSVSTNCPAACSSGQAVQVTVTYRVTLILGFVLPSPTVDMERSVEMLVP